MSKYTILDQ